MYIFLTSVWWKCQVTECHSSVRCKCQVQVSGVRVSSNFQVQVLAAIYVYFIPNNYILVVQGRYKFKSNSTHSYQNCNFTYNTSILSDYYKLKAMLIICFFPQFCFQSTRQTFKIIILVYIIQKSIDNLNWVKFEYVNSKRLVLVAKGILS